MARGSISGTMQDRLLTPASSPDCSIRAVGPQLEISARVTCASSTPRVLGRRMATRWKGTPTGLEQAPRNRCTVLATLTVRVWLVGPHRSPIARNVPGRLALLYLDGLGTEDLCKRQPLCDEALFDGLSGVDADTAARRPVSYTHLTLPTKR